MHTPARQSLRLSGGTELSFVTAGAPDAPAVLLLHGFPNSSRSFRGLLPLLAPVARVLAPDLPGFGESEPLPAPSFAAFAAAIGELLERLAVGPRYLYLHDFGAPVALHLAMQAPALVRGLIVQNANAHESGLGPAWAATREHWSQPNAHNTAQATAHLTPDGMRDQYVAGLPAELAARMPAAN